MAEPVSLPAKKRKRPKPPAGEDKAPKKRKDEKGTAAAKPHAEKVWRPLFSCNIPETIEHARNDSRH